ncbi:interferon-induced very large GTPase 1-like protein [Labeo rohita]|uniref:Interferon-induced very large GTPase 1-like protein n=1 Tax=Labeo rohita TaxID=84645 RepID=A0A498NT45_LABRO|nr:interferon-induced very large GTPase 1-like protein [Labeo rohita]
MTDPNLDNILGASPETDCFPFIEGQNSKEDINQTQHMSNLEPGAEASSSKPDGEADISESPELCDSDSSVKSIDSVFPNLTIVLTGNTSAVHFGQENILLKENVEISRIVQMKISKYHVSVINMTGLHADELSPSSVDCIGQLVNEKINAFIYVVRMDQLTDADKMGLEWLQRAFGDNVLQFVMILFTYERKEECDTIKDDMEKTPLSELLEKCGRRYHICSKRMNDQSEIKKQMKKKDEKD